MEVLVCEEGKEGVRKMSSLVAFIVSVWGKLLAPRLRAADTGCVLGYFISRGFSIGSSLPLKQSIHQPCHLVMLGFLPAAGRCLKLTRMLRSSRGVGIRGPAACAGCEEAEGRLLTQPWSCSALCLQGAAFSCPFHLEMEAAFLVPCL